MPHAPTPPGVTSAPVTTVTPVMVPYAPMLTSAPTDPTTALTAVPAQTLTVVSNAPAMLVTPVMVSTVKMMMSAPTLHVPRVPSVPTMQVVSHALVVTTLSVMDTTVARLTCAPLTTHVMPTPTALTWTSVLASQVSPVTDLPVLTITNATAKTTVILMLHVITLMAVMSVSATMV